ncbi:sugar phosphate isomerase/epimerase [Microlunatus panaciterrae]|uniref:Sugar phosphate isomerase/epimerase n=1 Tax=Microlunatus panaciterrae TaxID=400768 RepID=A0ABS2RJV1_9ACTN|nr:sugar phosphate isomerase/epimerase [Microlunatus panaciterrae]MBM7799285.1 sugar phosphate isomerase/epimerase [Microlunatus panaciterrae]
MKFGFSSYSFHQRLQNGSMSLSDVIDWVAESEGEHLELAVLSGVPEGPLPTINSDPDFVQAIKKKAADAGVELSNLAIPAGFFHDDPAEVRAEIDRVKKYVDLADELGMRLLRHDVAHRNEPGDDTPVFEKALPIIVESAKEIAQYAAERGITTSLENHGFFVQSSDRVRRVVHAVDEPNFRTTLDIGNFLCVDEDPTVAVPQNLPYASIVHLKDFYVRPQNENPGEGWFRSRGGKYLRGAIVGNGDIEMRTVIKSIKESGYDGFVSIEFEGHEDCLIGCARGIANAIRLFDEA